MVQISMDYFHTCGMIIYEAIYNQYDELNSHTGVRDGSHMWRRAEPSGQPVAQ